MKHCHKITCWTDYPFNDEPSRIRHVQVLCYDGDKYATVMDLQTGEIEHVKAGYLYRKAEAVKILRDVEAHIRDQNPCQASCGELDLLAQDDQPAQT